MGRLAQFDELVMLSIDLILIQRQPPLDRGTPEYESAFQELKAQCGYTLLTRYFEAMTATQLAEYHMVIASKARHSAEWWWEFFGDRIPNFHELNQIALEDWFLANVRPEIAVRYKNAFKENQKNLPR